MHRNETSHKCPGQCPGVEPREYAHSAPRWHLVGGTGLPASSSGARPVHTRVLTSLGDLTAAGRAPRVTESPDVCGLRARQLSLEKTGEQSTLHSLPGPGPSCLGETLRPAWPGAPLGCSLAGTLQVQAAGALGSERASDPTCLSASARQV